MMGFGGEYGMMGGGWGSWGTLGFLTWVLVVAFLMLGIVYFWKEINRKK